MMLSIRFTTAFLTLFMSGSISVTWGAIRPSDYRSRVSQYNIVALRPVERISTKEIEAGIVPYPPTYQSMPSNRQSLGSALYRVAPAASPGYAIANTYEDWQYSVKGRHVEWRVTPDIRFTYTSDLVSSGGTPIPRYGFQVYDPNLSNGNQSMSTLLPSLPDTARWSNLAIDGAGLSGVAGEVFTGTSRSARSFRNASTYSPVFSQLLSSADRQNPVIETQTVSGQEVLNVVYHGSLMYGSGSYPSLRRYEIRYLRKVGAGAWSSEVIIDTAAYGAHVTSSRVSNKIAIMYCKHTATALMNDEDGDEDVYYRESTDGGATWGAKTNITNYNRSQSSYSPWIEVHGVYDSNDKLHIIYNAQPVMADPYDNGFDWSSLLNGSVLFHWSNATGVGRISTIYRAIWDEYDMLNNLCGLGGVNMLTTGQFSISECSGRLYVIWVMANKLTRYNRRVDDCAQNHWDWRHAGNGEIYLSISQNLNGTMWDCASNLTNSYSPGCDSAGGSGTCYSDMRPTMARLGMDSSAMAALVGGHISWPQPDLIPPGYARTNDSMLHILYVEDHYPGSVVYQPAASTGTNNPMKWVRLSCVQPSLCPRIWVCIQPCFLDCWRRPDPRCFWVPHGTAKTLTVDVDNSGTGTLSAAISKTQFNGPPGWLATSTTSLSVPAGTTTSFNITLNSGGIVNLPGSTVPLNGMVRLVTNDPDQDTIEIPIENFLVQDSAHVIWDETQTAPGANGDFVALAVAGMGETGHGGIGSANMDFADAPLECDSGRDIYLYSGSPLVLQKTGASSYQLAASLYASLNSVPPSSDWTYLSPISGEVFENLLLAGGLAAPAMMSTDSVQIRRSFFAPQTGSDSSDFIIVETRFKNLAATPAAQITLGDVIDWDIGARSNCGSGPGWCTPQNIPLITNMAVGLRAADATSSGCSNRKRFGAQKFLGMRLVGDSLLEITPHNQHSVRNDTSWWQFGSGYSASELWSASNVLTGLQALPDSSDLSIITTYKHNTTLQPGEELVAWTALTTVRQGTATDLSNNIDAAKKWFEDNVYCEDCFGITKLGNSKVVNSGKQTTVASIDATGEDGAAVDADTTGDTLQLTFAPVNQTTSGSTIDFKVYGTTSASLRTSEVTKQLNAYLAGVSFANAGGAIQISADFSSIGDPNVQIAVYNGNTLAGSTTVPGGGTIAIANSAGSGNPQVTSFQMIDGALPVIEIKFDRVAHFTATNSVAFNGDRIRLISLGATQTITGLTRVEIRAKNMTSFTITNVAFLRSQCCRGFTGNIDCDPLGQIDIADLATLIDYLYISFTPLCCQDAANVDGSLDRIIDISDLTALIDFMYISFTPPSACLSECASCAFQRGEVINAKSAE